MSIFKYAFKEAKCEIKKDIHGEEGELLIKSILSNNPSFKSFHNIVVRDNKGFTYQLDHIVITNKGIFVIETKNYRGKIYGNTSTRAWTQVVGYEEHNFVNPLFQNESHIKALKSIAKIPYPIISLVVFVRNNVKELNIDNVINANELNSYLNNYISDSLLNDGQINYLYNQLFETFKTQPTLEEHFRIINTIRNKIAKGICPICGSNLMWKVIDNKRKAVCSNTDCNYEVKPY